MEKQTARVEGLDLKYVDLGGDGPPCLLLHGASSHALAWEVYVERSSLPLHFIALEQRGHGDSDKPASGYAATDLGHDAAVFWAQLELEPAVVIGASMGGNSAVAMAAERPDLVRALILSDPAYKIPARVLDASAQQMSVSGQGFKDWTDMLTAIRDRYHYFTDGEIRDYVGANVLELPDGSLRWKWGMDALRQVNEHFRDDLRGLASRVQAPTLIVQAGERIVLPDDSAAELAQAIRESDLVVIEDATHSVHLDKQQEFDAAATQFLRRLHIIP